MPYFLQQVSLCTTGVHNQLEDVYIQGSFGYKIQNLQKKIIIGIIVKSWSVSLKVIKT